ncbi:hypothetical protein LCGC14_2555540 [marine sediment metagenome]|uniref:Uncharacterized protein n=1 Tax=marine sediment metagenome TaxID=412755 RepID=A0A0F9CXU5_9ZZZZ
MGLYALSESGDMTTSITFTVEQDTIIYTDDILVAPDKTVIDIDYLDTIFGDMPVDLSDINYTLQILLGNGNWANLTTIQPAL